MKLNCCVLAPPPPTTAAALKQDLALDAGATVLNHSMSLVQRMESLLALGNGSDVTLRVETVNTDEVKVIQAHGLVLTMQSDVFEELLLTRNGSSVVVRETPDCAAVFDKFIRYQSVTQHPDIGCGARSF